MNRGFSTFSSRRPLERGSSLGGPGRSSRSPFTSARADGIQHTHQNRPSNIPGLTPCTVLSRPPHSYPPRTRPSGPQCTSPTTSGSQMSSPFTHYLSCPNPPFPPPASPCVPVHPTASPPPFLLASTLWLWEGGRDGKGGCHLIPGNSQILIPSSPPRPCAHLTSLCPLGTQVRAPSLQVTLTLHPLKESSLAPAAPRVMGLGWGRRPGVEESQESRRVPRPLAARPLQIPPVSSGGARRHAPLLPSSLQFCCSSLTSHHGFRLHPSQQAPLCHLLSHLAQG